MNIRAPQGCPKKRPAQLPQNAWPAYERLKAELTAKATNAREYESAVREAARRAGV